jgi:hypothetical protein
MFHMEHFEELVGAMSHKSMGTWWAPLGTQDDYSETCGRG